MNEQTNQLQNIEASVNLLKRSFEDHDHDNNNSKKINFANIYFTRIFQEMEVITLADNAEITLPQPFGVGLATAGTIDEAALFCFKTDGSVQILSKTTNVDDADTDGDLCIYDAGTKTKIKNRLGSTKEIRYIIFY